MTGLDEFFGPNAGYAAELLDRYERDPGAVDAADRALIEAWHGMRVQAPTKDASHDGMPAARVARPAAAAADVDGVPGVEDIPRLAFPGGEAGSTVSGVAAAAALAQAIRIFGHLGARLDPLGSPPPGDPHLDSATYGVDDATLDRLPAGAVGGPVAEGAASAGEAIRRLAEIYRGSTGYELAHVQSSEERAWLFEAIESRRFAPPHDPIDERRLLDRLTEVSAFERFLHRAYPGQTRFSVEGVGMMIPMLDELIGRAADDGTKTILLGMAHRGRLNVLAHVLGKPYSQVLAEFEGRDKALRSRADDQNGGWAGDVKYHAGGRQEYEAGAVTVLMAPNPSHLEFVNPVVQGMARAADEDRRGPGRPTQDEVASLAVLIHGDAAFMGQGVVAETLNLSGIAGYRTGGTLHLIANNQLGFTTRPSEGRSTLYASDLAKGFEIPVVHVNAQDPEACLAAMRLAVAYRGRFRKDFLIDLIGYRRWGHNEGDEPSFTQPPMYAKIATLPTVREAFGQQLVERGIIDDDEADKLLRAGLDEFQSIRQAVLARAPEASAEDVPTVESTNGTADVEKADAPAPSFEQLRDINEELLRFPPDFEANPKLDRSLQRRRVAFESPDAPIDWGHAETLAFATLLREGTPIRLTGQDSARGTYSQRHLTFYDARTGDAYTPLEALSGAMASFDVRNSPLSENAALGFEYGYDVQAPDSLVIWEGQYGDFINGAQVIVDEFVVSGFAKWGLVSGLVLLLPHAWEGQGPDHSSGRLERFLQLAAEDNIVVANCSTAAQYYHLLRRQAHSLRHSPRPLIVMTPKSLLRHPLAAGRARELAEGRFQPVINDALAAKRRDSVRRIVLCSGKVWTDVAGDKRRPEDELLALVRVEELYPFPGDELREIIDAYPKAREIVWLQEEPRNMGAWAYMERRLRELLGPDRELRYVGRPELASPAEGWADAHAVEQRRIVSAILEGVVSHAG